MIYAPKKLTNASKGFEWQPIIKFQWRMILSLLIQKTLVYILTLRRLERYCLKIVLSISKKLWIIFAFYHVSIKYNNYYSREIKNTLIFDKIYTIWKWVMFINLMYLTSLSNWIKTIFRSIPWWKHKWRIFWFQETRWNIAINHVGWNGITDCFCFASQKLDFSREDALPIRIQA